MSGHDNVLYHTRNGLACLKYQGAGFSLFCIASTLNDRMICYHILLSNSDPHFVLIDRKSVV